MSARLLCQKINYIGLLSDNSRGERRTEGEQTAETGGDAKPGVNRPARCLENLRYVALSQTHYAQNDDWNDV